MKFETLVQSIFESVPEFQSFDQEDLDGGLQYIFLGAFGIFTRDAVTNNEPYATKCLNFINHIVNQYEGDADFIEMMQVGVLEILTDYATTQKAAVKHFDGKCLKMFTGLLTGGYFNDLRNNP